MQRWLVVVGSLLWSERKRNPEIGGARVLKIGRHNANDGITPSIHAHGPANDARVRAKSPLPIAMIDDDHLIASRRSLFRKKRPAQRRAHADHLKEVRRHSASNDAFGFS